MDENNNLRITCFKKDTYIQIEINPIMDAYVSLFDPLLQIPLCRLQFHKQWLLHPEAAVDLQKQILPLYTLLSFQIHKQSQAFLLAEEVNEQTGVYQKYDVHNWNKLTIGRKHCDIQFQLPYISNCHAYLIWENTEVWIVNQSSNGTYVNRKRVQTQRLQVGDCIFIMGLQILMGTDFIAINSQDERIKISEKLKPYQQKQSTLFPREQYSQIFQPLFHKATVVLLPDVTLDDPPMRHQRNSMPLLYSLGPSLTMGLAACTTAIFNVQNAMLNNQSLTSIMPSLVMSGSMMAGTIVWPLAAHAYEKRMDKRIEKQRQQLYKAYLKSVYDSLVQEHQSYDTWLHDRYPMAENQLLCMWQKRTQDEDFLTLCLGYGDLHVMRNFHTRKQELTIQVDPMQKLVNAFIHHEFILKKAPILYSLKAKPFLRIQGKQEDVRSFMVMLLWQLCSQYDPTSINVMIITNDEILAYLRFLPHLFDGDGNRYWVSDKKNMQKAFMRIAQQSLPCVIFSFTAKWTPLLHAEAFLHEHPQCMVIAHTENSQCDVEIIEEIGYVLHPVREPFIYRGEDAATGMQNMLMNLKMRSDEQQFPSQYSIFTMYQIHDITYFNMQKHWLESKPYRSLAIPIGIDEHHERIYLDLHEKAHGPHGIIAGMTGSGKSEWIITMILSLAMQFHPHDVSFLLIDYKGGGMAKAFETLPHVAGIITNLDGQFIQRSLVCIESELTRRQQVFAATCKQLQVASMDIYQYQQYYHNGQLKEPMSHLLIIADEFAELKQQQQEFMGQLIRMARIGRSLGIHLILATQKPNGVVDDQIWSNARFRVCLKVQEKADSMDMIKREEGALLKQSGRFYLQVGYNEVFLQGQAAYAQAKIDDSSNMEGAFLEWINDMGDVLATKKIKMSFGQPQPSQLQVILAKIVETATALNACATSLWLPPLPYEIVLSKSYCESGYLALFDHPKQQSQGYISILSNFEHTLVCGSEDEDKQMFLETYLYQLCHHYLPKQLRIIVFDFAHGALQGFHAFPQVMCVLDDRDQDRIAYVYQMLTALITKQKYQTNNKQTTCIVIHNLASFLEVYETWESLLIQLARDGLACGISLLISLSASSEIRYRFLQHFEQFFMFHMRDDSEYSTMLGTCKTNVKGSGRCLWKKHGIYEAQCMQLSKSTPLEVVAIELQDHYGQGVKLPSIPSHLFFSDMRRYYDRAKPALIPIGYNLTHRQPYYINLSNGIVCISGDSNAPHQFFATLKGWLKQLKIDFCEDATIWNHHDLLLLQDAKAMASIFLGEGAIIVCDMFMNIQSCTYETWYTTAKQQMLWVGPNFSLVRYQFDTSMTQIHNDIGIHEAISLQEGIHIRLLEVDNGTLSN